MSKRDRERGGFLKPDLGDEISETLSASPVAVESPAAPAPAPNILQTEEPAQLVTVEVFARGSGNPVMQAFAKTEKLEHASATRKLSKAQWRAEYDKFLSTPR